MSCGTFTRRSCNSIARCSLSLFLRVFLCLCMCAFFPQMLSPCRTLTKPHTHRHTVAFLCHPTRVRIFSVCRLFCPCKPFYFNFFHSGVRRLFFFVSTTALASALNSFGRSPAVRQQTQKKPNARILTQFLCAQQREFFPLPDGQQIMYWGVLYNTEKKRYQRANDVWRSLIALCSDTTHT